MITASVRPVKTPQPVVKLVMEMVDAERLRDMLSHMNHHNKASALNKTLSQLADALDNAGVEWNLTASPFKDPSAPLREGH